MKSRKLQAIEFELAQLTGLMEALHEGDAIERMNFEHRKQELEREREELLRQGGQGYLWSD